MASKEVTYDSMVVCLIEHAPRWQQFHVARAMNNQAAPRDSLYIKKKKLQSVKLQSLDHSQLHTKGIAQWLECWTRD